MPLKDERQNHAKKLPNVSSEILEKCHQPPGENTMPLKDELVTPKNLTCREILLPAAASTKTASKKSAPGKTPCL